MGKLESYIGTKVIQAELMDSFDFRTSVKGEDVSVVREQETAPGYKVRYPDGYTSWSPKGVFENAYRKITDDEKKLIL